jgi:hypothetical protein
MREQRNKPNVAKRMFVFAGVSSFKQYLVWNCRFAHLFLIQQSFLGAAN